MIVMTDESTVEQIHYSQWSDPMPPEHKNYWHDIGCIADLIGSLLEAYRSRPVEDKFGWDKWSSIIVTCTKEKYGGVRVYCQFAVRSVLEESWPQVDRGNNETFEEHVSRAYVRDARLYRRTYQMMYKLFPHYKQAIGEAADFPEFLFDTEKEFDEACKKITCYAEQKELVKEICCWTVFGKNKADQLSGQ